MSPSDATRAGAHVLVVDDEPDIRSLVKEILEDEGYEVSLAENAAAAREARRARRPDLVLLDIWMPDTDGISLLEEWSGSAGQEIPVIMISGHGTVETAVEATRLGAYDFIEKPLSLAKLVLAVEHALEAFRLKRENIGLKRDAHAIAEPIGRSELMQALREQVRRAAQHDTPVLITGESGTGKELIARYLHAHSPRAAGSFVRTHVAGLTGASGAAELLGAEHGDQVHYGALEGASGGTLLLEDIADLEPALQSRLVGALQEQSFVRIDGVEPVRLNARIVAATRREPAALVSSGRLREELYYQLNVVPIHVPALRKHREDVPVLIDFYVDLLVTRDNLPYRRFTVGAQNRLRNHAWPGNVRELVNVIQRLLILGRGEVIDQDEVEATLGTAPGPREPGDSPEEFALPLKEAREQFERAYLEHQLQRVGGSVSKVASRIGIERTHLYRKLKALGIDPKRVAAGPAE